MIPFTNDLGLRDYRPQVTLTPTPRRRWPWLLLLAVIAGLVGLLVGACR